MLIPGPMAQSEALRALSDIRSVIDRSTRYSTFSALSGFLTGVAALIGSGACGYYADFPGARAEEMSFVYVWAGVFAFASLQHVVLTTLKARKRGEVVWTPIARTAFLALLGPGLAGVLLTIVFIKQLNYQFLAGLWLLLYGCGLWAVSFFAPTFLRWLGVAFMLLGTVAWSTGETPGRWLGLGFGCLHLVFAAIVRMRYRR